jgi:transposase-like protein
LLRKNLFDANQLEAIVTDYHNAGLTPQEVAVMEFAEKLTLHAHTIQKEDVDKLRELGLADEEILDVAMASAMRNFFSKVSDAMGVEPDLQYLELEPNVRKAMQKGRPFAEGEICPYCYGTHIVKTIRTSDGREEFFCEPCQMGGLVKPKNRYSEAQKLQILEHYERYSPEGIYKTFGVSPATLARWEKARHGKKKNKK